MKTLDPYDKLAVLMAIEEKVFRAAQPLFDLTREAGVKPPNTRAYNAVRKAERELRKSHPDKVLDVRIGGQYEEGDHSKVDRMVDNKFRSGVVADSESDSIYIYCNESNKDKVLSFLRSNFKGIEVHARKDKGNPQVVGLGVWDDAIKWVKKRKLERHVVIDDRTKKEISLGYDKLFEQKKRKFDQKMAELNELRSLIHQ